MQVVDVSSESGAGVLESCAQSHGRRFLWRPGLMILLLLYLMAGIGWALDIITTDGKLYRGCTVTQVEGDAIRISYSDGAARIVYEKLPLALQKQYFDPAKVAAYREKLDEARRVAAIKADEERRQRQIAAAAAEEQREQEAEAQERAAQVQQQAEDDRKALAKEQADLRALTKHRMTQFGLGMLAIGAALGLFVYFLPTIIGKRKVNAVAIFALNLFLGWTFIGWIVALVWACTEDSAMERLARERLNAPPPQPEPPRRYYAQGGPQLEEGGARQLEEGRRYLESGGRYLE